jgi:hypothetical protein
MSAYGPEATSSDVCCSVVMSSKADVTQSSDFGRYFGYAGTQEQTEARGVVFQKGPSGPIN